MNRLILLSCALALLFVSQARPDDHSVHVDVLKRMDRDGDGVLHPKEIVKQANSYVAGLAKDAGLDHTQPIALDRLAHRLNLRRLHSAPVEVIKRFDRNSDGVLTSDEVPKEARTFVKRVVKEAGHGPGPVQLKSVHECHMARFSKLPDNHGDGSKVKGAGFRAPEHALEGARILISIYDDNGDGVLEKKEWARLHVDWHQEDKNRDARLSEKEVAHKLLSHGNK